MCTTSQPQAARDQSDHGVGGHMASLSWSSWLASARGYGRQGGAPKRVASAPPWSAGHPGFHLHKFRFIVETGASSRVVRATKKKAFVPFSMAWHIPIFILFQASGYQPGRTFSLGWTRMRKVKLSTMRSLGSMDRGQPASSKPGLFNASSDHGGEM